MAHSNAAEVREAVAGYRQPRLLSELDAARQLLEAAGIACQIEHTTGALPAGTDAVLAWTVREGVTNVIRHSRARHCTIRVSCEGGTVHAEILDDGGQRNEPNATQSDIGTGLAGLAERVRAAGGRIEARPRAAAGAAGFRLWVELPLPDRMTNEQEQRA